GDGGVDVGEVGVAGGDSAAVVDEDEVAVPAGVAGVGGGAGGCGDDGSAGGDGGHVLAGVWSPGAQDGVEPHPEPASPDDIRLLVRGPPLPCWWRAGWGAGLELSGSGGGAGDDESRDYQGCAEEQQEGCGDRRDQSGHRASSGRALNRIICPG